MQQFKIGDWVYINEDRRSLAQVKELDSNFNHRAKLHWSSENSTAWCSEMNYYKLWQPQKGEWCWFYDNTSSAVPILTQFDYMSEHIYVTTEIEILFSGEERSAYGFNSCIPFIGQLPEILKDRV